MKKIMVCGMVFLVLGLLLWSDVPAQELRIQSRAKVWDIYWNVGTQGVRAATPMSWYRPVGMQYPGYLWTAVPEGVYRLLESTELGAGISVEALERRNVWHDAGLEPVHRHAGGRRVPRLRVESDPGVGGRGCNGLRSFPGA